MQVRMIRDDGQQSRDMGVQWTCEDLSTCVLCNMHTFQSSPYGAPADIESAECLYEHHIWSDIEAIDVRIVKFVV